MKAIVLKQYSENIDLNIEEVDIPHVGDKDVLVKIVTAGVNPVDNIITRGQINSLENFHLPIIAGNEFVGIVVKIGKNVSDFKINDKVYAKVIPYKLGAFAEYISIDQSALSLVPSYLTDIEAAAIPLVGLTAYQCLELLNPKPNETIFITGATGGFGPLAICLAKSMGLKVIVNGNSNNKEYIMSLGVEQFIDKNDDYTKIISNVDYIIDTIGINEIQKEYSVLKEGGHLVSIKAVPNKRFAERMNYSLEKINAIDVNGKKIDELLATKNAIYDFVLVQPNGKQLEKISKILEKSNFKPAIDSIYDFNHINDALHKVDQHKLKGKVVVEIN